MFYKYGYSYIELLIVIGLIAFLGVSTTPYMTAFLGSNVIKSTEDSIVSMMRKAQYYSMSGRNDSIWGVCLRSNVIRLYAGSCDAPTIHEDYTVPSSVNVSGLSDIEFSRDRGEISSNTEINISNQYDSSLITVSPLGAITLN